MLNLTKKTKFLPLILTSIFFSSMNSPSFGAPEDFELLQSYIGTWKGRGEIIWNNGDKEAVKCKLNITKAKQEKVNYNGRCAFAGGNFSIAGTMAYIEEKQRYEAVMSTSTEFTGVAIGEKQGDNLIFELKNKNEKTGDDFEIDSDIKLEDGELFIGFTAKNITSGRVIKAQVPFTQ